MPAFEWETNATRDTVDEIQNTIKMNTRESKESKFERKVRKIVRVVSISI